MKMTKSMICFQFLVVFAALTLAVHDESQLHEARRNLAYGSNTARPKSWQGIQCHDMTWWDDGDGWDCKEWEKRNKCNSDYPGYTNFGFNVDDACCSCGGGIRVNGCKDAVDNWYDAYGSTYDCDWYASVAGACEKYGYDFENRGHTAKTACCACGGGDTGVWNVIRSGRRALGDIETLNTHSPIEKAEHEQTAPHVNMNQHRLNGVGRRLLGDVAKSTLETVLEEMQDAFQEMFPVAKPGNTFVQKEYYNFAEFTAAFNLTFHTFDFSNKVPEPGCPSTAPCYTGHSNSKQTTTSEDNIKRVVAFLWAHVKQESDALKAVKEYACAANLKDDVCCSYNDNEACNADTASSSKYFGRGVLQISHDYNYKKFGQWTNKLSDPGLKAGTTLNNFIGHADKIISSNYAWLSGLWYFVDAKMHICGSSGTEDIVGCFQRTTNKINGAQECDPDSSTNANEDETRLGYLIDAYKALNGGNGIPKGDGTYYNSVTEISETYQTCDFCLKDKDSSGWKDCSNEDEF